MITENENFKVVIRPKHWFIPNLPSHIWIVNVLVKTNEAFRVALRQSFKVGLESKEFLIQFPTELEAIEWVASLMDI